MSASQFATFIFLTREEESLPLFVTRYRDTLMPKQPGQRRIEVTEDDAEAALVWIENQQVRHATFMEGLHL